MEQRTKNRSDSISTTTVQNDPQKPGNTTEMMLPITLRRCPQTKVILWLRNKDGILLEDGIRRLVVL